MPDVTVIQPNGTAEAALEQNELSDGNETVRVLGFPKLLAEFDVEIERRVLANRESTTSVTVDLLTGTVGENDVYPELRTRTVSSTSLLSPHVERETAAETARSFVRRRTSHKYGSLTTPDIKVTREELVFKLFWVLPASSETVHVIDTITNEVVAEAVELDEVTQDPPSTS